MDKILLFSAFLLIFTGLGSAFASSTVSVDRSPCGIGIGEASVDVSAADGRVVFDGLYCANTGGYSVGTEEVEVKGNEVNTSFVVERPDEGLIVTQVITPVNFSESASVDSGNYNISYEVVLGEEVIESGSQSLEVSQASETGMLESLRAWFSSLLNQF